MQARKTTSIKMAGIQNVGDYWDHGKTYHHHFYLPTTPRFGFPGKLIG